MTSRDSDAANKHSSTFTNVAVALHFKVLESNQPTATQERLPTNVRRKLADKTTWHLMSSGTTSSHLEQYSIQHTTSKLNCLSRMVIASCDVRSWTSSWPYQIQAMVEYCSDRIPNHAPVQVGYVFESCHDRMS